MSIPRSTCLPLFEYLKNCFDYNLFDSFSIDSDRECRDPSVFFGMMYCCSVGMTKQCPRTTTCV